MNIFKNKMIRSTLTLCALFAAVNSEAKIYLDHETDPLPLFSLQVMFPTGMLSDSQVKAASMALYSEILEDGTERLTKQEFLDAMMSFGASVSFGAGRDTSSWGLTFPIIEGKDYEPLIGLVEENWKRPRINPETVEKAKLKMDSALKGSLDSDMGLAASTGRRWLGIKNFGLYPVLLEGLQGVTNLSIKSLAQATLNQEADLWAGYVGPKDYEALAEKILARVFSNHGKISKGAINRSMLKTPEKNEADSGKKTAIIVEKSGRSQTIVFTTGVFDEFPVDTQEELALHFGGHILGFSGLGSYFGDEIRNKRGLAYTVSPLQKFYLGHPAVGFLTNPVREKNKEALEVIAEIQTAAYAEADVFKVLPEDVWKRQWQSFRFGHILDNSSASARLALRKAVAEGELSPEFMKTKPSDWSIGRDDIRNYFQSNWAKATRVMVLVGDSKEIRPLLKKNFPEYEIKVIGMQETLSEKAYQ
ncbi:insulinase family protein [bacterium]|nr:insulinase family protein [bacterium]